ncbi:U3 small nucleolar ribonucleoprotein MPP10-like isoform X2 [Tubulanus polymorphus]|uniref:U3 small nucleolar ribonucleoprotein MPP10-like isoform X2 n=1 Tax=Tubulanus polymorphus TaxID=672921 RepID=UPI003DA21FCF
MAAPMKRGTKMHVLENVDKNLQKYTDKPEIFLSTQKTVEKGMKSCTKELYDFMKEFDSAADSNSTDALPELIVENFDDEQIWQEIELQNDPHISGLVKGLSQLIAFKGDLNLQLADDDDVGRGENESDQEESDQSEDDGSDSEFDADNLENETYDFDDEDIDEFDLLRKPGEELDDDEDDSSDIGEDDGECGRKKLVSKKRRKTVVDEKFFKMADMEEFLEMEDAKEERRLNGDDVNDAGDIDYFTEIGSDDEGDDVEGGKKDTKYGDFFDLPEGENKKNDSNGDDDDDDDDDDENDDGDEEESGFNLEDVDEDNENDDKIKHIPFKTAKLLSDDEEDNDASQKSSFEKRQERLQKRIREMEDVALMEKPWQLSGEVTGGKRPENSLLQENVQFDQTARPAPVITEETTKQLEDLIKQRIKDQAWDDVTRKIKPKDAPYEYKKRITLDQEKSKISLGEVYEQEYIKQTEEEAEEKADPQHEEIKKMLESLFIKLDALSNFHYTPKPAMPEVEIVSNLPSIAMEEVAPVSVSDAAMLAPEEIQEKNRGIEIGKSERTETDKKRDRRKIKTAKRKKIKEKEQREKLVEKIRPGLGNKYSKERALSELEKASKATDKLSLIKDKSSSAKKSLTSSKQFFNQLQDEVTSHINRQKGAPQVKKKQKSSATKLML